MIQSRNESTDNVNIHHNSLLNVFRFFSLALLYCHLLIDVHKRVSRCAACTTDDNLRPVDCKARPKTSSSLAEPRHSRGHARSQHERLAKHLARISPFRSFFIRVRPLQQLRPSAIRLRRPAATRLRSVPFASSPT